MPDNAAFVFSANSLQDYQDCPRRFELKYLLKQSWPAVESEPVLEFEHKVQLGSQFHQLVYQYLNGIRRTCCCARSPIRNWKAGSIIF
jgi:hypothetical protein